MNIGLSYMTQIRGGEDTGQLVGEDPNADEDATKTPKEEPRSLGGWIALTFNQLVASIGVGYHIQHNTDDTHSTITATGTISERSRTVPMGEWIEAGTVDSTAFTADSGVTFSCPLSGQSVSYTLIGSTMFLNMRLSNCTVSATASQFLHMRIPGGFTAVTSKGSVCIIYDNNSGTGVMGQVRVLADTRIVDFVRFDGAALQASAANTFINAQICFEVA